MGNILIADDDTTYRESMCRVLQREGYHVEGAEDVDSALLAMKARQFDMVVCDYRMPGKSGIDLLEELRRRESRVPVLMISACADEVTAARAVSLGALELIGKPVRRQDLIDRAAKVVGG